MPPLRRKPIRSSSSRATAAATTAPATQTVSEVTSILPPDPHTSSTAVRPVPPASLSLADALPEEPTPAMLLEEEALSSETSGSSEGSLLSTLEELEEEEPVTPTRPSKPSYTNSSSKSISQRRNSVVPSEARRWDQTSSHRSSQPGRTPPPSARRRSWRCYRHDILSALEYCAGDGACVRRYLLYHHNINIPSKIIRYYKSSSRSSDLQEGRSGGSRTSPRQPAES